MSHGRWTGSVAAAMRLGSDLQADQCLVELAANGQLDPLQAVFRAMPTNQSPMPPDAPEPLQRFFATQMAVPAWADQARIRRGEQVFLENGLPIAVVLLCKSIPEGYAAPALTKVLYMTGLLQNRPLRRLLGVLQMVLDVAVDGGFEPDGKALRVAMKLRLLHAGLRPIVVQNVPGYVAAHGVPCNHEDMLATVMGFSLVVVDGLQRLGAGLTQHEAEDLFYPWRVFCACMGIPEACIPTDLADAREFYAAYADRQYVPADRNVEGVLLAQAHTQMLRELLPPWTRALGLARLPEVYMALLMGPEGCERLKLQKVDTNRLLGRFAKRAVQTAATQQAEPLHVVFAPLSRQLSTAVYRTLIHKEFQGVPAIIVPTKVADVWQM